MLMANDAEICIRNRSQKTVCLIHATGRIFEMSIETKQKNRHLQIFIPTKTKNMRVNNYYKRVAHTKLECEMRIRIRFFSVTNW